MASSASPEAIEIRRRGRRRLIGAVTLVLLLVVFVPMLLDSEPRTPRESAILPIPSRNDAAPLPESPAVASKPQARVESPKGAAEGPKAASEAPKAVAETPRPATLEVAPAAPISQKTAEAAAPPAGFAVQVGAFRDEAKLKQAREKLAAAKVVHYTERLETSSGPLTRLRAGPFATREAAEAAQASLRRSALEGKVVPLQ